MGHLSHETLDTISYSLLWSQKTYSGLERLKIYFQQYEHRTPCIVWTKRWIRTPQSSLSHLFRAQPIYESPHQLLIYSISISDRMIKAGGNRTGPKGQTFKDLLVLEAERQYSWLFIAMKAEEETLLQATVQGERAIVRPKWDKLTYWQWSSSKLRKRS